MSACVAQVVYQELLAERWALPLPYSIFKGRFSSNFLPRYRSSCKTNSKCHTMKLKDQKRHIVRIILLVASFAFIAIDLLAQNPSIRHACRKATAPGYSITYDIVDYEEGDKFIVDLVYFDSIIGELVAPPPSSLSGYVGTKMICGGKGQHIDWQFSSTQRALYDKSTLILRLYPIKKKDQVLITRLEQKIARRENRLMKIMRKLDNNSNGKKRLAGLKKKKTSVMGRIVADRKSKQFKIDLICEDLLPLVEVKPSAICLTGIYDSIMASAGRPRTMDDLTDGIDLYAMNANRNSLYELRFDEFIDLNATRDKTYSFVLHLRTQKQRLQIGNFKYEVTWACGIVIETSSNSSDASLELSVIEKVPITLGRKKSVEKYKFHSIGLVGDSIRTALADAPSSINNDRKLTDFLSDFSKLWNIEDTKVTPRPIYYERVD